MYPESTRHRIRLVGAGIATSLSPALHEHEAAALGLTDYRYDLIDIAAQGIPVDGSGGTLRSAVAAGCTGFNITHPCKQAVAESLDELSDNARLLGAVNTVVVRDGRLIGHNTDHSGFLAALRRGLPDAALGRVVLAGAGGAGSAVAYALAAAGVRDLRIADLDPSRAADVCARLEAAFPQTTVTAIGLDAIEANLAHCDGVVNASPIGMVGYPGTPFDTGALHPGLWVADIVYRPLRTELVLAAIALGCAVLDGGQMLVAQAADTFALLTGVTPDPDRMRRHLGDLLAEQSAPIALEESR
ncbi:shikimate dehydrogenase [Rhodococcus sp. T2V]|uniref:shikimate dehydrogenase n=1 Tax=Rhodococcus sp. T2V TaxID=3034164 RepID=UPI0023E145A6|nr:shikimate dehydrogenase [Rhodococcus sp. T2V]MDF3304215.1 shikimate dehydrogenase [Rhodococcus sp. T2V]